ncbi:hypothetical protein SLA2020_188640 [Shorea laevis]
MHDLDGNWIIEGFVANIGNVSSFTAGVWDHREGLRLSHSLGITHLIAEMDSMAAVQVINNQSPKTIPIHPSD